jgi:biopolymer transport protein ExbD
MTSKRLKLLRFGRRQAQGSGINEINVTPIIDVALVLVVILLLTSPMALESTLALRRASSTARQADEQQKIDRVELSIVSEDSVKVNRTTVERAGLAKALAPLLLDSPIVVVRCADSVSHGTFVRVLDEARICGAAELAIVGK